MVTKNELAEQSKLAFDFIQKLYFEVSYLIKEVESNLNEQEENFIIGRPGGYSVSGRTSSGLEANNVKLWLMKRFAVYFAPVDFTITVKGQQKTPITGELKLLYMRFTLEDESINEPKIIFGVLYNLVDKKRHHDFEKFDRWMGHIEYCEHKVFSNPKDLQYEDAHIMMSGKFITLNLFDINDSVSIKEKIVDPMLDLYRSIQ